jgi:hypothetical protein
MSTQKIKNILIEDKGYYSDDHAVSSRCIQDIVWAYKKVEKAKEKAFAKKLKVVNSERTRKVLIEKRKSK